MHGARASERPNYDLVQTYLAQNPMYFHSSACSAHASTHLPIYPLIYYLLFDFTTKTEDRTLVMIIQHYIGSAWDSI